jgi:large subunit ribosomal protein L11
MKMPQQTIEALVEGGKASAGPPLGPALGPAGVNIQEVIAAINEKTKDMAGMKVPVKVIVNDDKSFEIEVGTPPISALILKELGMKKGSEETGKRRVADLTPEQAKKIARVKFGKDDQSAVNQVEGSARSMGITVGKGAVTEEEKQAYEEAKKLEEEEKAAAEAEKKEAEEKPEEEKPEAEEKPEEEKKEEKKEEQKDQ